MKNINLIILFIFTSFHSYAQQPNLNSEVKVTVTGQIVEKENGQPLEYATIIFTPVDDKNILGGISLDDGSFSIQVKKGVYDISVEFISFKTKSIPSTVIDKPIDLGTIVLESESEILSEVEIIAEKSTVEIRLDKKIYNVGKDMTVKGGTASDVLDNVPSVEVDVEGNVSLRGNENVRILVNGNPSGLIGLGGAQALRQLPADAIEKVEVITSPSARYDSEGTAGILNIILRKGRASGFNGSFNIKGGYPDIYGVSTNLNLRKKKINYFSTIGYEYRESPGNSFTRASYFDAIGNTYLFRNEDRENDRSNKNLNLRFGMEYFLGDKSSLTSSFIYRDSNGKDNTLNLIEELDSMQLPFRNNERNELEDSERNTYEFNLNFIQNFNKDGHRLNLDFKYGENESNDKTQINDFDTFPVFMMNSPERNATNRTSQDVMFKGDYVLPLGEKAEFEFGFKADLNQTDSDYLVEEFDSNTQQYYNNTNFSNTLDFEQNIYALYSQFGKKINKFTYLLGLRMEKTERTIDLIQSQEEFERTFTEFFPTVNLGLEISETESFTLGYSKRLRRPWFWFLNPFESRTSETYIMTGNINLDPTFTNSFDFGYLKRWNKFTLNSSVYYQRSTQTITMVQNEEIREIDGTDQLVIVRSPINLGTIDRLGIEFNANYNPYKWWRMSTSLNFFASETTGKYNGLSYDSKSENLSARLSSRITLPGSIDWQTNISYRGPSKSAYSKRKASTGVNLSLSKDVLKNNGTLSLAVSDLFNSRKYRTTNNSPSTISVGEFQWRERQILLNFTYRLNQKKQRQSPQRDFSGGPEEMF
jgi:hypothetical protein